MSAWINGFVGLAATLAVATQVLDLTWADAVVCVLAANVAGMVAVLTILKGERTPWVKRNILTRSRRTGPIFASLYFALQLAGAPAMREARNFVWLVIPTLLSTGFTILAFGPIQDRIVARIQRQSRN
jgi:hypothetical protein